MTTIKHIYSAIAFCLLMALLLPAQAWGQDGINVNGRVVDGLDNPLVGVTVTSEKGENSTLADFSGLFSLDVTDGSSRVVFRHAGFSNGVATIENAPLEVTMKATTFGGDDIIHTGFTSYRKISSTGAILSVAGSELEKSPTITTQETFAGRFPGLFTTETSSDPSSAVTRILVRGASTIRANQPAVVIDGMVFDYAYDELLDMMTSAEIESVSVLKDGASQALYGIQGGDGVIVITTKKGKAGPLRINVRADAMLQQVTTSPTFVSSAAYATLRNEAAYNDGLGKNFFYSNATIAKFASGGDREQYPNKNWYSDYFRPVNFVQRVNMDASGGNDAVTYYANVNAMHQGGMFNVEDQKYNQNFQLYRINFRSNVDVRINKYLSASLRLSGNISRDNTPTASMSSIYESMLIMPPTLNAVTPEILDPVTGEVSIPGGNVMTTQTITDPFYGRLNRIGYGNGTKTNLFTKVGLKLDMSFLTKGLSLSGNVGYRSETNHMLNTTRTYERWIRSGDPADLNFTHFGGEINGALNPQVSRTFLVLTNYGANLDYARSFGKHHVGAMAYIFYQHLIKTDTAQPWNLPYDRIGSGVELSYNYDDRYIVRFDAGYSGSEQYAGNARFIWTPGVSGAWVFSNEKFMKNVRWLSTLKFRASWGIAATDRSGLPRFAYLDNVTNDSAPSYFQWLIHEYGSGNPGIQAERIAKQNYGIDLGLFNQLDISFDWFKERSDNMVVVASATIPDYYGYSASMYPYVNDGIFENKGYEASVNWHKNIGRDWTLNLGGWFADAQNKVIRSGEIPLGSDYVYQYYEEGQPAGQSFGFLVDRSNGNGFYNFRDEIDNSPQNTIFTPRVGDLKFRDMNEDGVIDQKDAVPLGTGSVPRQFYGFHAGLKYRNFEISVMFQGVGKWETPMMSVRTDSSYDGIFNKLHEKAWTFERFESGEKITYPALTTSNYIDFNTDYFLYDRSYLRLKNAEIAYNLPASVCKKMRIGGLRLSLSGQNLVTWDNMKTKEFGPESDGPLAFPVMRLYSFGVKLQF